MTTLTDFLLARIAEDEEVARAAGDSPSKPIPRWLAGESNGAGIRRDDGVPVAGHSWPHEMDHIARFDPTRVLAECEAKRQIVEHAEPDLLALSPGDEHVLRLLTLPYADHTDYQPEWSTNG